MTAGTASGLAVIGGSGLGSLRGLEQVREVDVDTPYGRPSAPVQLGRYAGAEIAFLPRHGPGHSIAPHRINYRANLRALGDLGVGRVIAVAAVGGISAAMTPGRIVVPHQLIDYTCGREHTMFDAPGAVAHVDFTEPYCPLIRAALMDSAAACGIDAIGFGTYGATQGPRLETAAEIERLARDGCDIVGMTGMPEAALARELGMGYACCAVVANRAAGRGAGPIEIGVMERVLAEAMSGVHRILDGALRALAG
jgi:5'-methylthioinosine phosphorylase